MAPVNIQTSAGPVQISTELGQPEKPILAKLGQGFMSIQVWMTIEQAEQVASALLDAANEVKS